MNKKQYFNKKNKNREIKSSRLKPRCGKTRNETQKNSAGYRSSFTNLTITPGKKWFEYMTNSDLVIDSTVNSDVISNLRITAQSFIDAEAKLYKKYNETRKEKADFVWINTILHSGTLTDKISAHILLIQDSAICNFCSIEALVGMVNLKGKRECILAIDSLRDLFLSDLLVEDKKLKPFDQQPLNKLDDITEGNSGTKKKQLIVWLFEDKLKSTYTRFLKNLDSVSHDTVEKTKMKAVSAMFELLKCNPEQEQFLLEHLVNKIGDPIRKVGAHVCFLLGQLVDCHPNMKSFVTQEVERLLFRPNMCERTKYYCLCFLNQLILSSDDKKLATRLLTIYFSQFKVSIKKGEVNTKMMSALLTGVARAYPFASIEDNIFNDQLDAMYKLVHLVNFNISIQALMLIFQVLDSKDSVSDRFYSTLYRKLFDPALASSSRQAMLLNLVHRALKKDVSLNRVKAFTKRLLQISLYQAPPLQCGILYLISEAAKIHTGLLDDPPSVFEDDSDDEEHYEDVIDDNERDILKSQDSPTDLPQSETENLKHCPSSWIHREMKKVSKSSYDPQSRNPLHAGAEYCYFWELRYLKNCFHPSVSLFSHQVCASREIKYSGDPLQDFTLSRFLDRFVYRNPKQQPDSSKRDEHRKTFGSRGLYNPSGSRKLSVTSDAYLSQKEENVPAEEDFIFRFLRQQKMDGKLKEKDDSDIESINSDEFEGILNKYNIGDEGKDSLDFMKELSEQKKKGSKKQAVDESEEEMDDEFNSFESGSDLDDLDFEDDEDFQKAFEDFDEDIEDIDKANTSVLLNNENIGNSDIIPKIAKVGRRKSKLQKRMEPESLFVSADKFSTLLEDNVNSNIDSSTIDAFSNKDKSDVKQILWEKQRDRHVRNKTWKGHKRQKICKRKNAFQKKNRK